MRTTTIILLILSLVISKEAFSQIKNAKVKYSETIHIELPEHVQTMGRDIPPSREIKKILFVNGLESSYIVNLEDKEIEEGDDLKRNQRRGRGFRMSSTNSSIYTNTEENLFLEKINMFDKDFLIKEDIKTYKWKIIATEQREILGYTCMKAEYQDTSQLVTAWFAPQLPLSYGPAGYNGLPGLILAIAIGEDRIILASSLVSDLKEIKIEKPTDKKTYTREEFNTIRDEKIEEMKAMWGGNRRNH